MESELDGKLVLTVPEVARLLRISRGKAYEIVRTRQLPSLSWGRVIRIPRHALDQLLQGGERASPSNDE